MSISHTVQRFGVGDPIVGVHGSPLSDTAEGGGTAVAKAVRSVEKLAGKLYPVSVS